MRDQNRATFHRVSFAGAIIVAALTVIPSPVAQAGGGHGGGGGHAGGGYAGGSHAGGGRGAFVETQHGEPYRTRTVLIATGMSQRRLNVPGETRFERCGVSYTGVQDVARFQGADVATVGGGNSALQTVVDLASIARHIYVVSRGELTADAADVEKVRALPQATVLTHSAIQEISGSDRVEAIRVESLRDGETREVPVAGVFIAIGFVPNASFVGSLVERSAAGEIVIGPDCSTSAPGSSQPVM